MQHRTRRCSDDQEAEGSVCQGNITQSRPCQPHEVPGKHMGVNVSSVPTFESESSSCSFLVV